jgi:transcriptional regulator with GAF, ATPase, and Fis domain
MPHPPVPRATGPGRAAVFSAPAKAVLRGPSWSRRPYRAFVMAFSVGVVLYSLAVLLMVAYMGDIGIRCIFTNEVREPIPDSYTWGADRPQPHDKVLSVGPVVVEPYADYVKGLRAHPEGGSVNADSFAAYANYVKAMRELSRRVGETIEVSWAKNATLEVRSASVPVKYRPWATYLWSVIWFLQEMVIFALGARVFWKRPHDESARLFFWLCILTVGAYMGGYHWTEIVAEPLLIYPFAAMAVFLPVVTLHFYLVFPRANPVLAARPRAVMRTLYGVPAMYLAALWGAMLRSKWLATFGPREQVAGAVWTIRNLALGYVALAAVTFGLCVLCMVVSFRRAATRAERNQVQWVLLASLVSSLLIAYLLWKTTGDPATLGRDSSAWPMFGVSLCFTLAYAMSITRYKLMQVEQIINRSMVYVALSLTAGLLYSAVLILSGVLFREHLMSAPQTWRGAMVAGLTVVLVLVLSEVARGQFQKVIDRRFYREKYKFDQAMRKMRLAVGSLVDRETLGRRLLEAAAEVLRVEWGAIYLREAPGEALRLAACHGPAPDEQAIAPDNPLVERLRRVPAWRVPHAVAEEGSSDPATDAMIALGGEAANALEAGGDLAGLLVLGPKRSGMPYEDEEMAFLGALGSVATLALHSAGIQQTLEVLNHELRDKVEKIAEQQRRILILQDQLTTRPGAGKALADDPAHGDDVEGAGAGGAGQGEVFERIKGSSRAVRQMIELARKVAASPSAVLIRGESGTGKELIAEAIHAASLRGGRPFVKVHCAALSQTLLESELFGHVKGAFTSADRDRMGRFEQADGGTLFLDEIGDINLEVQTKLLRVVQEMAFERVGSSQTITVDVRILAATHQDLEALIRAGRFREDLYYRLNVISLQAPSLRERRDDIFELAVYFLQQQAERTGKPVTHLDEGAIEALTAHDWPGNIRELENVIERAVVLADGPAVTRDDLPPEVRQPSPLRRRLRPALAAAAAAATRGRPALPGPAATGSPARTAATAWSEPSLDDDAAWDGEVIAFERQRLLDALDEAHGNKSEAARLMGMPRSTFCSKLKKHGLG